MIHCVAYTRTELTSNREERCSNPNKVGGYQVQSPILMPELANLLGNDHNDADLQRVLEETEVTLANPIEYYLDCLSRAEIAGDDAAQKVYTAELYKAFKDRNHGDDYDRAIKRFETITVVDRNGNKIHKYADMLQALQPSISSNSAALLSGKHHVDSSCGGEARDQQVVDGPRGLTA